MPAILATILFLLAATSAHALELTSPDIGEGERLRGVQVYDGFGCSGANISPRISWRGAPDRTKSFALTVYDPDAPTGSGWWHWVLVDIPASVNMLMTDAGAVGGENLPGGRQIRNDYGEEGFGGACPPKGDKAHRYIFTLYALDVPSLGLPENATPAMAGYMIRQHALAKASITATYGR